LQISINGLSGLLEISQFLPQLLQFAPTRANAARFDNDGLNAIVGSRGAQRSPDVTDRGRSLCLYKWDRNIDRWCFWKISIERENQYRVARHSGLFTAKGTANGKEDDETSHHCHYDADRDSKDKLPHRRLRQSPRGSVAISSRVFHRSGHGEARGRNRGSMARRK
jgi:hypothetical protein